MKTAGILLAGLLLSGTAHAGDPPRWEAGVGLGGLRLADYRGSQTYRSHLWPLPYLVYHGPWLQADRDGVHGRMFRTPRVTLSLSGAVSLITDTGDNPLRQGMPELKPTFELGPALDIGLGEDPGQGWMLRLPARAVYAFDRSGLEYAGWVVQPQLRYRDLRVGTHWRLDWSAGVLFGNRRYHDYYYSVDPGQARPGRPAYRARPGYSGLSGQLSLSRRYGRLRYGTWLRYDNLSGAVFEDSPLVQTDHYFVLGLGVIWVFGQSADEMP